MTETTSQQEELQQDTPTQMMPGDMLKEGRERKSMSTDEVAKQLNLKHNFVVQIEANDFAQLPGATFIRGYLRAYSKLVGIDAEPVVEAYNKICTEEKKPESRYKPVETIKPQRNFSDPLIKYTTIIVIAAIVGLSILWWQSRSGIEPLNVSLSDTVTVETSEGETVIAQMDLAGSDDDAVLEEGTVSEGDNNAAEVSDGGTAVVEDETTSEPEADAIESSEATAAEDANEESNNVVPENNTPVAETVVEEVAEATPAQPEVTAEAQPVSAPVAAKPAPDLKPVPVGLVRYVINYSEECWVEISDARGLRVVNNLKKPGEQSVVTGLPPFKVMIGNATGAEVIYLGEVVDLKPHTNRNNIARMSLGKAEDVDNQ